jgi:hypothetical protein
MRTSPRTTHLVCAALLGGALLGCRSRGRGDPFLVTRVPVERLDSVLKAADSVHLRLADARTLMGVVAESDFAAKLPHDTMTIAEIVAWGRAQHVQRDSVAAAAAAARRVREEQLQRQLDSLLAVTVVSKSYLPKDPDMERFQDYISLTFAYHNRGKKAIRAFQGDVAFIDTFGDSIYSAHLKVDRPLAPGQTRQEPGRIIKYNPFRTEHERLRNTPLSKLKVIWHASDVVFADGSRVSLESPP